MYSTAVTPLSKYSSACLKNHGLNQRPISLSLPGSHQLTMFPVIRTDFSLEYTRHSTNSLASVSLEAFSNSWKLAISKFKHFWSSLKDEVFQFLEHRNYVNRLLQWVDGFVLHFDELFDGDHLNGGTGQESQSSIRPRNGVEQVWILLRTAIHHAPICQYELVRLANVLKWKVSY